MNMMRRMLLPGIILLGFLTRLYLALQVYTSPSDTSTVGVMALDIMKGARPLFYYGQSYMGALEAYVASLMFSLFGASPETLTLAPILFALGWIASMYFLFHELFDHRAGLAAALCTAVAGWFPIWFSLGAYGGYPEYLMLGTLALALSVRMLFRPLSRRAEWGHLLGIGASAGVAVWVNLQVAPYLITSAVLLVVLWIRRRFDGRLAGMYVVAGCLATLGLLPYVLVPPVGDGMMMGGAGLSFLQGNVRILLARCLPQLIYWPASTSLVSRVGVPLLVLAGLVLAGWRVKQQSGWSLRLKMCIPLLFSVIFMVIYLPHRMAATGAPRYLIPVQMMLLGAVMGAGFGLKRRAGRVVAGSILSLWVLYNGFHIVRMGLEGAAGKKLTMQSRMALIESARQAGLPGAMIIGGLTESYDGLTFSFYAKGAPYFVSPYDDRVLRYTEAWHRDPTAGFMFNTQHRAYVEGSLQAMEIFDYVIDEHPNRSFLYGIRVPRRQRRSIPPSDLSVDTHGTTKGSGALLLDRRHSSVVESQDGNSFRLSVDLGASRTVDGYWLTTTNFDRLPSSYTVSISSNGVDYSVVQAIDSRFSESYIAGSRVYFKGFLTRQECRFAPVDGRYLRIDVAAFERERHISEIYVFEREGEGKAIEDEDFRQIAAAINKAGCSFTAADIFLSAALQPLLAAGDGALPVYPPFNPRNPAATIDRCLAVTPALAVVVERALADETARFFDLHLPAGMYQHSLTFEHWSVFFFEGAAPYPLDIYWNGHAPLLP